jgi:ribosomal protein S18 acetylase RimI-like enzyme
MIERQAQHAAAMAGYKGMTLNVYASNVRAIGFYEALGWQKTDGGGHTIRMIKRWE